MNRKTLSSNELAVLRALWSSEDPLSRPEMLERISNPDWNPSSIHMVLNNLMKKGYVQVAGVAPCGQRFGRTYSAVMTQAEYAAGLALSAVADLPEEKGLADVLVAMVREKPVSEETIALLEQMLEQRRRELREKAKTPSDGK